MVMRLIFQMYQKTCSVCQGVINKDCVESSGRFYHSNCMKVFYLRSLTEKYISERNSIYTQYCQCFDCRTVLDGSYYVLMGQFYCERDYNVRSNVFEMIEK